MNGGRCCLMPTDGTQFKLQPRGTRDQLLRDTVVLNEDTGTYPHRNFAQIDKSGFVINDMTLVQRRAHTPCSRVASLLLDVEGGRAATGADSF